MALGIAQRAVVVDAPGEEVIEQALLNLLQLGDDLFGLADGVVDAVEDRGDLALLGEGWKIGAKTAQLRLAEVLLTAGSAENPVQLRANLIGLKGTRQVLARH